MREQDTPIPFWDAIVQQKRMNKDAKIQWLLECVRDQHTPALLLANAVLDYGWHVNMCDGADGKSPCTCGYMRAVAVAKELVCQEANHDKS